MNLEQFRLLFLAASEVPAGMRRTQDTRRDPGQPGETVWMAREGSIWRLIDRREVGGALPGPRARVLQSGSGFRIEEGEEGSLVAHFLVGSVVGSLTAFPEEGKSLDPTVLAPLLDRALVRAGGTPSGGSAVVAPPKPAPAPTEFAVPDATVYAEEEPQPQRGPSEEWAPPPKPRPRPEPEIVPLDGDKPKPRRRGPVGPVAALLLCVLVGVALAVGGGAYYWWAHRPFCGEVAPPGEPRLTACLERLQTYGDKLLAFKKRTGSFPFNADKTLGDFPAPQCPISGDDLRYILEADEQRAFLYCPGCAHLEGNRPAYDFSTGKAQEQPLEPRPKTWLHYQWEVSLSTPTSYQAALEDLNGFMLDRAYMGELKADVYLYLDRFQDCYDVITATHGDDDWDFDTKFVRISALRGLGKYDEALAQARENESGVNSLLYLTKKDDELLAAARRDEGRVPDSFLTLVPFTRQDYPAALKEAQRYLESSGYSALGTDELVAMGVISAVHCQQVPLAREILKRALREGMRDRYFPVLRALNGELTVEQAAQGMLPGEETQLRCWVGCLDEALGRKAQAKANFEWVRDKGSKFEATYRLATSRL